MLSPATWSYLLAAVGILGLVLAGRGLKAGWLVGFLAQILWVVYALLTGQHGFILSAVAYAAVYITNWSRWRRAENARLEQEYRETRARLYGEHRS